MSEKLSSGMINPKQANKRYKDCSVEGNAVTVSNLSIKQIRKGNFKGDISEQNIWISQLKLKLR